MLPWSHNCVFNRRLFGFVPMPGFPLEAAHVVTSKHPQRDRMSIHVEPFLRLRVGEAIPVDERRCENSIKVYRRSLSCGRFFIYLGSKDFVLFCTFIFIQNFYLRVKIYILSGVIFNFNL